MVHSHQFLRSITFAANLAWNRAVCIAGDSKSAITLPLGYEQVYAILTSQIIAHVKNHGLEGAMTQMTAVQETKLMELRSRAVAWDVSYDLHPGLFPTRDVIPASTKVDPTVRLANITIVSDAPSGTSNLTSVVVDAYRKSKGQWFKRDFVPTALLELSNTDQHCCALACSAYISMSKFSGSARVIDTCCQDSNLHGCKLREEEVVRTLVAEATHVQAPTKTDSEPALYTFAV